MAEGMHPRELVTHTGETGMTIYGFLCLPRGSEISQRTRFLSKIGDEEGWSSLGIILWLFFVELLTELYGKLDIVQ